VAVTLTCPQCQKKLRVKDELAGRTGKCPACGSRVTIPALQAPPPSQTISADAGPGPVSNHALAGDDAPPQRREGASLKQMVSSDLARSILGKCKCGMILQPQKRRCPGCSAYVAPIFLLIVQILLGLYGLYLLGVVVYGIGGGIPKDEFVIVLPVFLGISAVLGLLVWGLSRGSTVAWHLWTCLLGLALFGSMAAFIPMDAGLSAGVFVFSSLIYVGIAWRTTNPDRWRILSVVYGVVAALAAVLAFTKAERVGSAIGIAVLVSAIAGLIVWTYSVNVRWWYHVRLGWSGGYIGEEKPETHKVN